MTAFHIAINFVGGNLQKQADILALGFFKQNVNAINIGLDKGARETFVAHQTAVDVRFCREIKDRIAATHGFAHVRNIANIAFDKAKLRVVLIGREVFHTSRVSQFIEHDDIDIGAFFAQEFHKIAADKTRAASY